MSPQAGGFSWGICVSESGFDFLSEKSDMTPCYVFEDSKENKHLFVEKKIKIMYDLFMVKKIACVNNYVSMHRKKIEEENQFSF